MLKIFNLYFILLLITTKYTAKAYENPSPTETFQNTLVLTPPDVYYLYWNANSQNITFELHVKDSTWLLFGIQGLSQSNVIVTSIFEDSTGHYSERSLFNDTTLATNQNLNWILLDAFKSNGYTVIKFIRDIKLQCNQSTSSLDINSGLNTLVFAYGDTFNKADNTISISNLNTTKVDLLPTVTNESQLKCVDPPVTPVFNSSPTGIYSNYVDLMPGIFRLYWNVTDSNLTAEIHCQTEGWVGFGLSPNGGMAGSNVVIGFLASDGSVNFTDRFITADNKILIAANQSVRLLASGRINNYVYFKFTRLINVCDSQHLSISVIKSYN